MRRRFDPEADFFEEGNLQRTRHFTDFYAAATVATATATATATAAASSGKSSSYAIAIVVYTSEHRRAARGLIRVANGWGS